MIEHNNTSIPTLNYKKYNTIKKCIPIENITDDMYYVKNNNKFTCTLKNNSSWGMY